MKVTVEHTKEEQQDIFQPGNIVFSDRGIVIVHGPQKDGMFSGIVIDHEDYHLGYYTESWDKSRYELFKGKIILEQ